MLNSDNYTQTYIQTRTPDVSELANLIRKAKGFNRTMREFAEMCGASASMFSRIANGKFIQPLSLDILTKIYLNADPDAGVCIEDLTVANGMISKEILSRDDSCEANVQKDEQRLSIENEMKNIISVALLERGLAISYQKRIYISKGIPAIVAGCGHGNLLVQVQGYEPIYWKYRMMPYIGIKRCEADLMFRDEAEYFLLDAWEPEKLCKVKMSYVFSDRQIYEAFYKRVENAKVNNWISIVLVNLKLGCVIEERFLNRVDGKTCSSVFELPLIREDEEYFDLNPKTTDMLEE